MSIHDWAGIICLLTLFPGSVLMFFGTAIWSNGWALIGWFVLGFGSLAAYGVTS